MTQKIKEVKLSKKEKEANIIEEVLLKWSDDVENNIKDPKRETVWIAGYMFIYVDGDWIYDIDYYIVNDKFNMWTALKILQEVISAGIKNVIVGAGSQTVWDKNNKYQGSLNWGDGLEMLSNNPELTEKEVEKILTQKTIKEFKQEQN